LKSRHKALRTLVGLSALLVVGRDALAGGILNHAVCKGIVAAAGAGPNPYVALFETPEFAGWTRMLAVRDDLTPAAKAEAAWDWLAKQHPELAKPEERAYIEDVFELSIPAYKSLGIVFGSRPETLPGAFADATYRIANQSPKERFVRSKGAFINFPDKIEGFAKAFFDREKALSNRFRSLAGDIANVSTWHDLSSGIRQIQTEMNLRQSVSTGTITRVLGGALLTAQEKIVQFRTQLALFPAEFAEINRAREEYLDIGQEKMAKLNAANSHNQVQIDETDRTSLDVENLDAIKMTLDMNEIILKRSFDILDGLESAFESTRGVTRPDFQYSSVKRDSPSYQAIEKLQSLLENKVQKPGTK
jgi:hypothetical protein